MPEAIVIGAGVGGLAAAIVLAHAGRRVVVLEQAAVPGGKAGIADIAGIEVDTGPSVLTLPEVFAELLGLAGMAPEEHLPLRRPSPFFRYLYPDGVALDLHCDLGATLDRVREVLGSAAADELSGFLRYAARIWDGAAPYFVFGPAPKPLDLLRGAAWLRRIDPLSTMAAAIRGRVRSPHLRALLLRYATYNGSDPRCAPATLNCIAHVELALGGYGVEGGMYQIVRALVLAAARLGVELHCDTQVTRILVRSGAACGVELAGGRELLAPLLIANADAEAVRRHLLPPAQRGALAQRPAPSTSGYTAILRARRLHGAQARVAHTVLFPHDYEEEFVDLFDRDRPPQQPTVYLCAQEACHGRRGWPSHEPVFVMVNAPALRGEGQVPAERWLDLADRVRTRLLLAGLCDAGDEVVWQRTPVELADQFPGSGGSLYGAASNGALAAFRRPPNAVRGVPGLFLASGSAHPGGGLPLAALSGRTAARAALEVRP